MHTEDDFLPISALQHLLFCERQTALIHIERLWEDNRWTAEGNVLHQKADAAKSETRDGVRITRGLQVHSFRLGLSGVCDVVQFKPPEFETEQNISLPKRIQRELNRMTNRATEEGGARASESEDFSSETKSSVAPSLDGAPSFAGWIITPVEYKRGRPKANDCDRVQLCAQAMALEEMLGVAIARGDLFYGSQQRRTSVTFDDALRQKTVDTAARLHDLIRSQQTPITMKQKKCDKCSLLNVCLPPAAQQPSASDYLNIMID